ncbi:MAG: sulfate reduction electron transfer complex DsrMKJOP subunit DsrJ [Deltaproteobacteria bacterium]|nr:sulfate reduction electron transfer complex DsrMKJOP subunit DsrJ [Deltaproteobacteria bacterium]
MNDKGKIVAGLIIFLAVFSFPFWYNLGQAKPIPKPELPAKKVATQCVEATAYMKTSHMRVLDIWRNSVVRDGNRFYASELSGKEFDMSLSNTCMQCHTSKVKFCDQCHNYVGVSPYCWTCHIEPKEKK